MSRLKIKNNSAMRRANRVRSTIRTNSDRPRLSVTVSNRHISAQIIDDKQHKTLASSTTIGTKAAGSLSEQARVIGKDIAKKAKANKIKEATLDRGSKLYHGRVKALADAAREEGLVI